MKKRNLTSQKGYAMIVIAALLAAFMTVVGSVLEGNVVDEQIDRQQKAADQMKVLTKSLEQYAVFNNNRYPCPARPDLAYSHATFGAAISGCYTGALNAGGLVGIRGLPDDTAGSEVVRGMIPVRALAPFGITLEDAFDPWGARIMYVVHRQLTPTGSGIMTTGATLTEPVTSTTLGQPDFLLISYGKDHLGGIMRSQTSTMTATSSCPTASTKIAEENCDSDLTFYRQPIFISPNAVAANYFDDIVTSYSGASEVGCIASKAVWNINCSATPASGMPHGSTLTVPNSGAGYTGSATLTCSNGAYFISNNYCQPTGANCTWATTYNTWTGTTDCNSIPGWATQPICGTTAPCTITTTDGTQTTYAAAAAACTNSMCRVTNTCTTNYGGSSNTATATMRVCRPDAGCAGGAKAWNTDCSGTYISNIVGGTVNATNTAQGFSGTISGTCQGDGSITWAAGSCAAATCSLPWGGTIASGASVTAYQSNLPTGACVGQTRTCASGILSGSYTYQTCTAGCIAATKAWLTNCSKSYTPQIAGAGFALTNSVAGYTGVINGVCNAGGAGTVSWDAGSCAVDGGGSGGGCFTAKTLVTMADGIKKPISELKAGDEVRGETKINRVIKPDTYESAENIYSFNGGDPFVTGEHRLMTTKGWRSIDPELAVKESKGKIRPEKLEVGDVLVLENGKTLKVTSIDPHPQPMQTLYNPGLDGDHTYYANGILVHNIKPAPGDGDTVSF